MLSDPRLVSKPDHIFDLERRQQVLEEEIDRALLHRSPDDSMVGDLKRRILHLKQELKRFYNKAIADRRRPITESVLQKDKSSFA